MIIVKIIYGILLFIGGILLIKYRNKVHDTMGNWYWAEKYLGNGGTFLAMFLIGIFLMFLGITYPFGGINLFIGGN